jgi:RES domain-containing protein
MNDWQRFPGASALEGEPGGAATTQSPSQVRGATPTTIAIYRVVRADQAVGAFDREHNLAGGRWSSPGVGAIYAAQSPAGAVLEYLAHREEAQPEELVLVEGRLAADWIALPAALPPRWRDTPYREEVRAFGDEWLRTHQAVALSLPSVLCEASRNLLINPDHPHIDRLELVQVHAFALDPRLVFPK